MRFSEGPLGMIRRLDGGPNVICHREWPSFHRVFHPWSQSQVASRLSPGSPPSAVSMSARRTRTSEVVSKVSPSMTRSMVSVASISQAPAAQSNASRIKDKAEAMVPPRCASVVERST